MPETRRVTLANITVKIVCRDDTEAIAIKAGIREALGAAESSGIRMILDERDLPIDKLPEAIRDLVPNVD